MKESRLQKKIKLAIRRKYGGMWIKIHGGPYQKAGMPDLWGLIQGLSIHIEVKRPGKKKTLSEVQKRCISQINHYGGYAFVATTVTYALLIVRKILLAHDKTLKKQAVLLPKKSAKSWTADGLRRIIYASGNWKNHHRVKNIVDSMEKKAS